MKIAIDGKVYNVADNDELILEDENLSSNTVTIKALDCEIVIQEVNVIPESPS